MKNGWETKKLGDVCTVFADGDWVESKDQSSSGIRLIQTGNVGEGFFKDRGEKARYISLETFSRLRCTEIFEGDCLVSRLPDPAGRCCLIPDTGEQMITAVDCTIVRFDLKQMLPRFFIYYSQSDEYLSSIDSETTGTTRKRVKLPPAKLEAYWVSPSKGPLNREPPKAATALVSFGHTAHPLPLGCGCTFLPSLHQVLPSRQNIP